LPVAFSVWVRFVDSCSAYRQHFPLRDASADDDDDDDGNDVGDDDGDLVIAD